MNIVQRVRVLSKLKMFTKARPITSQITSPYSNFMMKRYFSSEKKLEAEHKEQSQETVDSKINPSTENSQTNAQEEAKEKIFDESEKDQTIFVGANFNLDTKDTSFNFEDIPDREIYDPKRFLLFNLNGEHILYSNKDHVVKQNKFKLIPFTLLFAGGTYAFVKKALMLSASEKFITDVIKCGLWMTFGIAFPIVIMRNIQRFASGSGNVKLVYELALKENGQQVVVRCLGDHAYEIPIREIFIKNRFMLEKSAYVPTVKNMTLVFNYKDPKTNQDLEFMLDNIPKEPRTYDIILKIIEGIPILCISKDQETHNEKEETQEKKD